MTKLQYILKILIILILASLMISCATFHKIDGIHDYTQIELQIGDSVKVTTKNDEIIDMVIAKTDGKYLYGEKKDVVVKKEDIKSLELSRFYPGKILFGFLGLILFSIFFSG
jgi:hypothetical protein